MPRLPREVALDWARARPDRIPIRLEGRGSFDFGERAVGRRGDVRVYGMVGWDPALGWVLVVESVPSPGLRSTASGSAA
ncbi:MAG TPA: hypothetical protein VF802_05085 [Candidatus Limnocylindrales bacterium]